MGWRQEQVAPEVHWCNYPANYKGSTNRGLPLRIQMCWQGRLIHPFQSSSGLHQAAQSLPFCHVKGVNPGCSNRPSTCAWCLLLALSQAFPLQATCKAKWSLQPPNFALHFAWLLIRALLSWFSKALAFPFLGRVLWQWNMDQKEREHGLITIESWASAIQLPLSS